MYGVRSIGAPIFDDCRMVFDVDGWYVDVLGRGILYDVSTGVGERERYYSRAFG